MKIAFVIIALLWSLTSFSQKEIIKSIDLKEVEVKPYSKKVYKNFGFYHQKNPNETNLFSLNKKEVGVIIKTNDEHLYSISDILIKFKSNRKDSIIISFYNLNRVGNPSENSFITIKSRVRNRFKLNIEQKQLNLNPNGIFVSIKKLNNKDDLNSSKIEMTSKSKNPKSFIKLDNRWLPIHEVYPNFQFNFKLSLKVY